MWQLVSVFALYSVRLANRSSQLWLPDRLLLCSSLRKSCDFLNQFNCYCYFQCAQVLLQTSCYCFQSANDNGYHSVFNLPERLISLARSCSSLAPFRPLLCLQALQWCLLGLPCLCLCLTDISIIIISFTYLLWLLIYRVRHKSKPLLVYQ